MAFENWNVTYWLVTVLVGIISYQLLVRLIHHIVRDQHRRATKKNRRTQRKGRHGDLDKAPSIYKEMLKILNIQNGEYEDVVNFEVIADKFENMRDVSDAVKEAGLESSNIIIGVDFTASNEWQGKKSFEHRSLHHIFKNKRLNPYQKVISAIAESLEPFDDDNLIPCYGFGDKSTKDTKVFPFREHDKPCSGFRHVLDTYREVVLKTELSGPTSFAPIINKAIAIVKEKKTYHILVIIADGQVDEEQEIATREAIVEASQYPLSIVLVGVGDGPWDVMEEYDERLPRRKFDNFQFVDYHSVIKKSKNPDSAFALHALMEIPDQYKTIKTLGYLDKQYELTNTFDLERTNNNMLKKQAIIN